MVKDNHLIQRVFTEWLNPFFQTRREISRSVRLGLPETFFKRKLEQVYYYGAGCTSYEKKNVLGASLVAQFKTPIQFLSNHSLQSVSYAVRFRIEYKYIVFFNMPIQKLLKLHFIVLFSCFALLS